MSTIYTRQSPAWSSHLVVLASAVALVTCLVTGVSAQDAIDHGATGTLNHDYFAAIASPVGSHELWLVGDVQRNHLKPAISDIAAGRYEAARRDLEYLLQRFVNDPSGLFAMVTVGELTKQPLTALPYFQVALNLYPQYALTHAQYGMYLTKVGRPNEGLTSLQHAIEIDPSLAVSHAWLADTYLQLGRRDLAQASAQRAQELGYRGKIAAEGSMTR